MVSLTRVIQPAEVLILYQHAWWHLGTGLGSYYLATSCQLLVLSLREDPHDIEVDYAFHGILPFVKRVRSPHYPNGDVIPDRKSVTAQKKVNGVSRHAKNA